MNHRGSKQVLDNWIAKKIGIKTERLTRRQIEAWQLSALNRTLELAYNNSSFYRGLFGKVNLNCLSDMAKLPFTTPNDLKENPLKMVCTSPGDISRIVTLCTSGSTGGSKRVFFTPDDQELCIDFFHHGMQLIVDKNDVIGILFPALRPGSVGDLLQKGISRIGASSYTLYEGYKDELKLTRLLLSKNLTSLAGPPSILKRLANYYLNNPSISRPNIKSVLLSAEYVSENCREIIKSAWGSKIYEHYGMTEMGLGCAVSCEGQLADPMHLGYHVREADIYIEIIDPETGFPRLDGQKGEIVFTTLTRSGMPFIRYRTGDISCWLTKSCSCGSVLKLLARVGDRGLAKGYPT